jgi:hypothetical protein
MKRTLPADIHGVGGGGAESKNGWYGVTGDQQPLSSGIVSAEVDKGKGKRKTMLHA